MDLILLNDKSVPLHLVSTCIKRHYSLPSLWRSRYSASSMPGCSAHLSVPLPAALCVQLVSQAFPDCKCYGIDLQICAPMLTSKGDDGD